MKGLSLCAGRDRGIHSAHSMGYSNATALKAKNVKNIAGELKKRFQGKVPANYKALLSLPGVGPKIAMLVKSLAFGQERCGIVV
eukprot:CAMPEP_0182907002 /NCGR_PEP_ID=MMETSP0034_2-20130328/34172_1 /TAXON_ID=156128 /ORGANISM="Nephroselmis pyriformis, Strain CCMP717" /LENGTH=83 /DNA_ID=CAMNT_0025042831 /DNA_START=78 /DNA_END=326 /DNA_ORIENTATION=-